MNENIAATASWYRRRQLRDAYQDYVTSEILQFRPNAQWCDVTLSMKQGIVIDGTYHRLTYREAHKAIKELLKRVNRRIYKNGYRRFKKRLACVPVVETGKLSRIHIHMLLEVPSYMEQDPYSFLDIVQQEWKKSPWSHKKDQLGLITSDEDVCGWIRYILKDLSENDEILDPKNVYWGTPTEDEKSPIH